MLIMLLWVFGIRWINLQMLFTIESLSFTGALGNRVESEMLQAVQRVSGLKESTPELSEDIFS